LLTGLFFSTSSTRDLISGEVLGQTVDFSQKNQRSGEEKRKKWECERDTELPCVYGLKGISSLGIIVALVKVWSG